MNEWLKDPRNQELLDMIYGETAANTNLLQAFLDKVPYRKDTPSGHPLYLTDRDDEAHKFWFEPVDRFEIDDLLLQLPHYCNSLLNWFVTRSYFSEYFDHIRLHFLSCGVHLAYILDPVAVFF